MKTPKVSEATHTKLTSVVGRFNTETGKIKTHFVGIIQAAIQFQIVSFSEGKVPSETQGDEGWNNRRRMK